MSVLCWDVMEIMVFGYAKSENEIEFFSKSTFHIISASFSDAMLEKFPELALRQFIFIIFVRILYITFISRYNQDFMSRCYEIRVYGPAEFKNDNHF